jgi:hypothetical protein
MQLVHATRRLEQLEPLAQGTVEDVNEGAHDRLFDGVADQLIDVAGNINLDVPVKSKVRLDRAQGDVRIGKSHGLHRRLAKGNKARNRRGCTHRKVDSGIGSVQDARNRLREGDTASIRDDLDIDESFKTAGQVPLNVKAGLPLCAAKEGHLNIAASRDNRHVINDKVAQSSHIANGVDQGSRSRAILAEDDIHLLCNGQLEIEGVQACLEGITNSHVQDRGEDGQDLAKGNLSKVTVSYSTIVFVRFSTKGRGVSQRGSKGEGGDEEGREEES